MLGFEGIILWEEQNRRFEQFEKPMLDQNIRYELE